MSHGVFREKSIKQASSPEQLNDYLKVAGSGVWLVLLGILVLLAGLCVWGAFGRLDSVIRAGAVCEDGVLTCYIREKEAAQVEVGMKVTVGDEDYTISSISDLPQMIIEDSVSDANLQYVINIGDLKPGEWIYTAEVLTDLKNGVYEAGITVESVSPLSFIIN